MDMCLSLSHCPFLLQSIIDAHYPLVARALVEARQEVLVCGGHAFVLPR